MNPEIYMRLEATFVLFVLMCLIWSVLVIARHYQRRPPVARYRDLHRYAPGAFKVGGHLK